MSKQSDLVNITQGDADINGGTIDGTVIGGSTPAAISGTTGQFGTSLNVDGTITSDGLTVGTAVYPTSGALSNRNKIINGGFDVWQRGTSFSSSSVNEYSADRFRTEGFSLSTTISRQTFTAGQTDVPDFPTYFCRVATSATVGSGQYWAFQQRIEVPQVVSQGQTYTLSFWIRATSGTISAGALSYGFSGGGFVGFPELTTTWQKVTRTLTFGASQISGGYASVYVVYAPQNTTAFSVDIANVQLEVGDTATPFEHRSYGQELALCQRYYEIFLGQIDSAYNPSTVSTNYGTWFFKTEKRTTPTITQQGLNITATNALNRTAAQWYGPVANLLRISNATASAEL